MSTETVPWAPVPKAVPSFGSPWTEHVTVPAFVTHNAYFPKSDLADLLLVSPKTGETTITVRADPMNINTESVMVTIGEATRAWLAENVAMRDELDPQSYLFESPNTEPVPAGWLEALYALPVHDDHGLVMDYEDES